MEEFADYLIWGGLGIIIARLVVPRLLDYLGVGVEKRPEVRSGVSDV